MCIETVPEEVADAEAEAEEEREINPLPVSYTHPRAHETALDIVCRLLLEKKTYPPSLIFSPCSRSTSTIPSRIPSSPYRPHTSTRPPAD